MLKAFYKARRKKGFTLIEIIVVLAIIGVLLALAVPALNYDKRPSQGVSMSKDMLYNTQDIMSSMKSAAPDALDSTKMEWYTNTITSSGAKYFVIYADINDRGEVTDSGLVSKSGGTLSVKKFSDLSASVTDTDSDSLDSQFRRLCEKTAEGLENGLTLSENMAGTLTAAVDSNFNVKEAYWFQTGLLTAAEKMTDRAFVDNYALTSGYICSSYPSELSTQGREALDIK